MHDECIGFPFGFSLFSFGGENARNRHSGFADAQCFYSLTRSEHG
jgi:hypothetical protein